MDNVRLKILPPWSIFIKEIEALFGGDPQITCTADWSGTSPAITLACNNGDKVTALQQILPTEVNYGNVILKINIDGAPADRAFKDKVELFNVAFEGNPVYAYSVCPYEEGYVWIPVTYVVFKNHVVQFFADNLNDCHGLISCLYQDIAEKVLTGPATQDVYFNTDVEQGELGKPLNEWP